MRMPKGVIFRESGCHRLSIKMAPQKHKNTYFHDKIKLVLALHKQKVHVTVIGINYVPEFVIRVENHIVQRAVP